MGKLINQSFSNDEIESRGRDLIGWSRKLFLTTAFAWSLFQLWIASPLPFLFGWGVLIDLPKRGIHLAFALLLVYLLFPAFSNGRVKNTTGLRDLFIGLLAVVCTLYLPIAYTGIVDRNGILLVIPVGPWSIPIEYFIGGCGIICLLEACLLYTSPSPRD